MSVVCIRTELQHFPLSSVESSSHNICVWIQSPSESLAKDLTSNRTRCLEVGLEDLYPIPAPKC